MTSVLQDAPTMDVRRSDPEFQRDGYAVWDRIRETGPVVYAPGPVGGPSPMPLDDAYLVTRFATIRKVVGNPKKFPQVPGMVEAAFGDQTFEAIEDPHRHGEIRGIWSNEFQRGTLAEKRTGLVESVVRQYLDPLVDRVLDGATTELLVAHDAVPISVMLSMLDLPLADRDQLHAWASSMSGEYVSATETVGGGVRSGTLELRDYLSAVLIERKRDLSVGRRHPESDLLSMMLGSEVAETMTESEIVANCTQLVFAGAGTTSSMLSACVVLLAQHPDQRRQVVADRTLLDAAIEEVLRFRGPAHAAPPRLVADGDADIEGYRIPEGAIVSPVLGAANRDPERWENPAVFDINRPARQHFAFGFGMHHCFGSSLARLQTKAYLDRLLDLVPAYVVDAEIDLSKDPFFGSVSAPIPSIPIARG
ncbi:MAG: cytochrome P450 [Actinomycetota bacterium]|nr:cytochrome P450 [Actinomycetota bacterium]